MVFPVLSAPVRGDGLGLVRSRSSGEKDRLCWKLAQAVEDRVGDV